MFSFCHVFLGILIQYLGKASTTWEQKKHPKRNDNEVEKFYGTETYLVKSEYLFGKENCKYIVKKK